MTSGIPPTSVSSLSSSSSSSSSFSKSIKKAEIAGWINDWVDEVKEDRMGTISAIRRVFTEDEYKEHVLSMDKTHLVTIMIQCLNGKFINGVTTNPGRVDAIIEVLQELAEHEKDEQQEHDGQQHEHVEATVEIQEQEESSPSTPTPTTLKSKRAASAILTRITSPRKSKAIANQKISEQVHGTTELLQQFAANTSGLSRNGKGPRKEEVNSVKKKHKQTSSTNSRDHNNVSDSSDTDSSSSDSDSGAASPICSSDSSSSDSDDVSKVVVLSKKKNVKHKNSIRSAKKKEGYKYAKQVWEMCNGRVHHYLNRHEWTNKRTAHEIDTLTRVFDVRMRNGGKLYDEDIRLLACRILVLQSQDVSGSWEVADQFAAKPMGYVVLSKKQLSRAAKQAEQLQKVMPRSKSSFKQSADFNSNWNSNSYNHDQGYRPRGDNQRNTWKNDRTQGSSNTNNRSNNSGSNHNTNSNNNNNNSRATGGAGSSNMQ